MAKGTPSPNCSRSFWLHGAKSGLENVAREWDCAGWWVMGYSTFLKLGQFSKSKHALPNFFMAWNKTWFFGHFGQENCCFGIAYEAPKIPTWSQSWGPEMGKCKHFPITFWTWNWVFLWWSLVSNQKKWGKHLLNATEIPRGLKTIPVDAGLYPTSAPQHCDVQVVLMWQ